jgi:hypothetical protein
MAGRRFCPLTFCLFIAIKPPSQANPGRTIMIIQDLLGALARRLETGALALDSHHLCCLKVNTLEITLEFVKQQNCLFVYLKNKTGT